MIILAIAALFMIGALLAQRAGVSALLAGLALTLPIGCWAALSDGWVWGFAALGVSDVMLQLGFLAGSVFAIAGADAGKRPAPFGDGAGSQTVWARLRLLPRSAGANAP